MKVEVCKLNVFFYIQLMRIIIYKFEWLSGFFFSFFSSFLLIMNLRHSLLLAVSLFLVDHFCLVTGVFMRVVLSQIFSFVL